jgi:hypothetical protein
MVRGVRFKRLLLAVFLIFLSGGWSLQVYAWFTPMHSDITREAFARLPEEIQRVFTPYIDDILWASMVPDYLIRDWENHEWNIHRELGDKSAAPFRIEALSREITGYLRQSPIDFDSAAYAVGLISHYIADINQPLHTDDYANDNAWIHLQYETDVDNHKQILHSTGAGVIFKPDIFQAVIDSARQANLYYQAIIDVYTSGEDYQLLRGVTGLNYQRAVGDIANIWATLWFQATRTTPFLSLHINRDCFHPGDMMRVTLSVMPGSRAGVPADLYVVTADPDGKLWFMVPGGGFTAEISPYLRACSLSSLGERVLCSDTLANSVRTADFVLYGLLMTPGSSPANRKQWLSNIAEVHFRVEPTSGDPLDEIYDEPCLFPGTFSASGKNCALSLRRWDFIFLGGKIGDPAAVVDGSLSSRLIPGDFYKVMIYLGRDRLGRPCALELAPNPVPPNLRVVRFFEFNQFWPDKVRGNIPVKYENLWSYRNRQVKRLNGQGLKKLRKVESDILIRIARDLKTDIPYRPAYAWSGDLSDKRVVLLDNGLVEGASCTGYLVALFEESAGICLKGSRMTAAEIKDYFCHDPIGKLVEIPDELSPFPSSITVSDVFAMGFYLEDPPPHVYPCDTSVEIGVPVPAKLVNSPEFVDIDPVPVPAGYGDNGGFKTER